MSDVCKEDDQDTPANKPDVPKTKKKAPANEDGLSTKHDIWSKSTIPRVFPVADVSNDDRTAKSKNSIPSLMSNGIDAPPEERLLLGNKKEYKWQLVKLMKNLCLLLEAPILTTTLRFQMAYVTP